MKLLGCCRLCGEKLAERPQHHRRPLDLKVQLRCARCPYDIEYTRTSRLRLFREHWFRGKGEYTLLYFPEEVWRTERPHVMARPPWTTDRTELVPDREVYRYG